MGNILIHKASELKPGTRAALEAELGRSLRDDEEVSIMAFEPHRAPTGEAQSQATRGLQEHFTRIDQRRKDMPGKEMDETLNEALGSVRPGYRERE